MCNPLIFRHPDASNWMMQWNGGSDAMLPSTPLVADEEREERGSHVSDRWYKSESEALASCCLGHSDRAEGKGHTHKRFRQPAQSLVQAACAHIYATA